MLKLSVGEQLLLSVVVRETIYNYLGSNITAPVSLVSELDARIGKAASMFEKNLSRVWANKHLTLQVKIRVYVACEISMLLCGCETWPIHRNQKKRLNAFHFRCLQSIPGVPWRYLIPNNVILERTGAQDVFSSHMGYIDFVEVAMCAEWKMVVFRSTSYMGSCLLLLDLSVAQLTIEGCTNEGFEGTLNLNTKT